jgi:ArsR family metal-binding transcriptional regulator
MSLLLIGLAAENLLEIYEYGSDAKTLDYIPPFFPNVNYVRQNKTLAFMKGEKLETGWLTPTYFETNKGIIKGKD